MHWKNRINVVTVVAATAFGAAFGEPGLFAGRSLAPTDLLWCLAALMLLSMVYKGACDRYFGRIMASGVIAIICMVVVCLHEATRYSGFTPLMWLLALTSIAIATSALHAAQKSRDVSHGLVLQVF